MSFTHSLLVAIALLFTACKAGVVPVPEKTLTLEGFKTLLGNHAAESSNPNRKLQEGDDGPVELLLAAIADLGGLDSPAFAMAFADAAGGGAGSGSTNTLSRSEFKDLLENGLGLSEEDAEELAVQFYDNAANNSDFGGGPNSGPDFEEFKEFLIGVAAADPHLVMWDGTHYDFMGECDTVLVTSKSFSNNLGLDVHMRTTMTGMYSYIEAIAFKLGDMIVEVNAEHPDEDGDVKVIVNGVEIAEKDMPFALPEGGLVVSAYNPENAADETRKIKKKDGSVITNRFNKYRIHSQDIEMAFWVTHKMYLSYDIQASGSNLHDARGMMGTFSKHSEPLSRKDVLMTANKKEQAATDKFSMEWQVQGNDPRLFQTNRAPQWPQKCNMPAVSATSRRLRAVDPKRLALAESACGHIKNPDDVADCKYDVIATGIVDFAEVYA